MTAYEEPPVVELEELLDEQESPGAARAGRQITLIVALIVVGLVCVSVLAAMLVPVVAEVVRWIVFTIRLTQGG